jgi:hypothetical protein
MYFLLLLFIIYILIYRGNIDDVPLFKTLFAISPHHIALYTQ